MRTAEFDFALPRELIAQNPATPRDAARLLEVGRDLGDLGVVDLPQLLAPGDVMVFNDARVIPARLVGRRGAAKIEITLHRRMSNGDWRAFARPSRRLRPSDRIDIAPDFAAEVLDRLAGGEVILRLAPPGDLVTALRRHGVMPLPPYIRRPARGDPRDAADYQTIYAEKDGAVAAPTAGLHFTKALFDALDARGVRRVMLTLNVGAGTFLPVKSENARDHKMHAEYGVVTPEAAEAINAARGAGGRVVAVGTTSLRLLESAADARGCLHPFAGETDLFILPGHRFRAVDLLMTNFHLPRSTLFMLVCAFSGRERMMRAYEHAVATRYRFYSYGDACLLHRADEISGRTQPRGDGQ